MPFPLVDVTVNLNEMTGAPAALVKITQQLDRPDAWSGGNVAPFAQTIEADENGIAVFPSFPNDPVTGLGRLGSVYSFFAQLPSGQVWSARAQVPDQDCQLQDIMLLDDPPPLPSAVVRVDVVQAFTTAQQKQGRDNLALGTQVDLEVPGGAVDGVNVSFNLVHSPSPAASCMGYIRQGGFGAFLPAIYGLDFVLIGALVVMTVAPDAGSTLRFSYRY